MNISRWLYNLLWWLMLPLVRRYLRRRARKAPAYLQHWDERFGRACNARQQVIWVHAVSVGETRAAQPLIAVLRERFPNVPLLITQMTPTGRETARQLYPDAEVRYLPYDRPAYVARFYADHRPLFGILMETELWPNLIFGAKQTGVPLFLANARLSEKSLRGYQRVRCLIRPAVQALTGVAAQTAEDAERLRSLGADYVEVCGNTKYDVPPPPLQLTLGKQLHQLTGKRPIWLCASTRDGEEELILQAWREYRQQALLLIVPRHPERFVAVENLARDMGYHVQKRSDQQPLTADTEVWIGDSMGEMFAYYTLADLAFIGGSLLPFGGQNLIEAAAMGVPTLFGPNMFNFQQASELALQAGAARQVDDARQLVQTVVGLLQQPAQRQAMSVAALDFSTDQRGASLRIAEFICERCK